MIPTSQQPGTRTRSLLRKDFGPCAPLWTCTWAVGCCDKCRHPDTARGSLLKSLTALTLLGLTAVFLISCSSPTPTPNPTPTPVPTPFPTNWITGSPSDGSLNILTEAVEFSTQDKRDAPILAVSCPVDSESPFVFVDWRVEYTSRADGFTDVGLKFDDQEAVQERWLELDEQAISTTNDIDFLVRARRSETVYFQLDRLLGMTAKFDIKGLDKHLDNYSSICKPDALEVERVYMGDDASITVRALAEEFAPVFKVHHPVLELSCFENGKKTVSLKVRPRNLFNSSPSDKEQSKIATSVGTFDEEVGTPLSLMLSYFGAELQPNSVPDFIENLRKSSRLVLDGEFNSGDGFTAEFNTSDIDEALSSTPFCGT